MLETLATALTAALTPCGWPATVVPAELGERDGYPVPLVRQAGTRREFTFPARDAAFAYLRPRREVEMRTALDTTLGRGDFWELVLPLRLVLHRPRPLNEKRLAFDLGLQLALLVPPTLRAVRPTLGVRSVEVDELAPLVSAAELVRQEHGAAVAGPPPGDYLAVDFTLRLLAEGKCLRTLCP